MWDLRTSLNQWRRPCWTSQISRAAWPTWMTPWFGGWGVLDRLREVREENLRHSQLVTNTENLKHIFTVPETVAKTELWIEEKKLLAAHQSLVDLENSRNHLLLELHRLGHKNTRDLLKKCFEMTCQASWRSNLALPQ
jgi:hypothetical protein